MVSKEDIVERALSSLPRKSRQQSADFINPTENDELSGGPAPPLPSPFSLPKQDAAVCNTGAAKGIFSDHSWQNEDGAVHDIEDGLLLGNFVASKRGLSGEKRSSNLISISHSWMFLIHSGIFTNVDMFLRGWVDVDAAQQVDCDGQSHCVMN
jgi:hypothetical protein